MDADERKWQRIRDVLVAEGTGKTPPAIRSARTLFGIPSSVDQAIDAIVAEDEAKRRAQREKAAGGTGSESGRPGDAAAEATGTGGTAAPRS